MKRSHSIFAIILALFIYVGVIGTMYVFSIYKGHKIERNRTKSLMSSVTWNVEEFLYLMNHSATSYLSSYGNVVRDNNSYAVLIINEQTLDLLRTKHFANSLKSYVHSNDYTASAFFYFEPGVIDRQPYQPFCHRGDSIITQTNQYFDFGNSILYHQVQKRHRNWWHASNKLSVFNEPIMSCCTPIYVNDTTQFIGAFVMDFTLASLNAYLHISKPYDESELFVINSRNNVIAQSDSMYFGYSEANLPLWNPTEFGNDEVAFPYLPWRLRMYTPEEAVQEKLLYFLDTFIIFGIIGLVLLSLCLLFAIRSIKQSSSEQLAIENELHMAGAIQRSLLPASLPKIPEVQITALLRPAREVAGDIYEIQLVDHYIYFMIGDVSGKGLQASMLMAMLSGLFRHQIHNIHLPSQMMSELNQSLVERNPEVLFCTMLIGRLDRRTGELFLCNAGHNVPVLDGIFLPLQTNIALGIIPDYPFSNEQFWLEPEHTLLCYTDGVTEAKNKENELFGNERLLRLKTDINLIIKAVDNFSNGTKQADDITLLTLSYTPWVMHSIDDIANLRTYLQQTLHLADEQVANIQLPIEELSVNAFTHGKASWVSVSVYIEDNQIITDLVDNGTAFDPTQYVADKTNPEDLEIGGQGILLARQLTETMTYERCLQYNHLHCSTPSPNAKA